MTSPTAPSAPPRPPPPPPLPVAHHDLLRTTVDVLTHFYAPPPPPPPPPPPRVASPPSPAAPGVALKPPCEDDVVVAEQEQEEHVAESGNDVHGAVSPARPWSIAELPFLRTTGPVLDAAAAAAAAAGQVDSDDADEHTPLTTLLVLLTRLAFPVAATQMLGLSMAITTTFFMGHYLTTTQFAAAATGLSFTNLTAISIGSGFCSALDTLATQEHGRRKNSPEIAAIFLRSILCTFAVYLPIALLYAVCDPLLELLIHHDLVADTAYFLRMSVFIATPMLLVNNFLKFAQSQKVTQLGVLGSGVGAVTLPPLLFLFRHGGLPGVITALSINRCLTLAVVVAGVVRNTDLRQCWVGRSLAGHIAAVMADGPALVRFVKTGIPVFAANCADSWCFEVLAIAAARLGVVGAAVWSVAMLIYSLLFGGFIGIAAAAAIRIGNAMGRGRGLLARRYSYATALLSLCLSCVCATLLYMCVGYFFELVQRDAEVARRGAALSFIMSLTFLFDAVFYALQGPFRGSGNNGVLFGIIVVGMWGVAVPTGLLLSQQMGYEERGLFYGFTAGTACVVPLQLGFLWGVLPWERQAAIASRPPS
ncbi:MatE [Novymonas esmeraldas]|uniref:MatE n=1 Tax=Novymonas esmeraldas TaxID=1808958 RepID=A0AAW0ELW3_9TRYP